MPLQGSNRSMPVQGLSNQGSAAIVPPYSLAVQFDAPMTVEQLWNWQADAGANRSVIGTLSQVRQLTLQVLL